MRTSRLLHAVQIRVLQFPPKTVLGVLDDICRREQLLHPQVHESITDRGKYYGLRELSGGRQARNELFPVPRSGDRDTEQQLNDTEYDVFGLHSSFWVAPLLGTASSTSVMSSDQ